MKRKWKVLVCLLLICFMLPLNASAGLYWGQIVRITSKSSVNVYSGPGRDFTFYGAAMSSNTYDFLGQEGDWYYIQFTSTKRGYIPAMYAVIEGGLVWHEGSGEAEAVVRNTHCNPLNLRSKPNKNSLVVGIMRPDTVLEYCGTENGWNRVLTNGEYAYVAGNRTAIEVTDAFALTDCDVCGGSAVCKVCKGRGWSLSADTACSSCSGLGTCPSCSGQ